MNNQHITKKKIAIALGFFDGVHLGHGALLGAVRKNPQGLPSAALTFDRHPGTVLGKTQVPLLSTVEDRRLLMQAYYHLDQVIVADFSAISSMDWEDFVQQYLCQELGVGHVVAGHDFRFGHKGLGDGEKLRKKCQELGITCEIIPPVTLGQVLVSSTYIREQIEAGEMALACQFLGHPHLLSNQVEHGNKIGKSALGFPTVNLKIPPGIIVPPYGVYACRVWVEGTAYLAVSNVGIRPTLPDSHPDKVTVEGFMLDFPDRPLYGTRLSMEFHHFIRREEKFSNLQALTEQIAKDVETTVCFFRESGYPLS